MRIYGFVSTRIFEIEDTLTRCFEHRIYERIFRNLKESNLLVDTSVR